MLTPMTVTIAQLEQIEQQVRSRGSAGAKIVGDLIEREIKRRKGIDRLKSPLTKQERNRINSANYRKRQAEQRDS